MLKYERSNDIPVYSYKTTKTQRWSPVIIIVVVIIIILVL